ncbi:hypothetical protein pb186bvf_014476 [Paramecium bursaria]
MQYTIFSVTFAFYGLFFFIDQYQKAKQKRKLFLKGQRNKLFEKLIKEFIDEKVCIIEKDEDNIKFNLIIINDRLKELSEDINLMIKSLEICYKQSLQNYLYKTIKCREILLCKFKNRVFEVKYSRYIIKRCQIFIKIKEIYHNQHSLVNYKELSEINSLKEIILIKLPSKISREIIKKQYILILVLKILSCFIRLRLRQQKFNFEIIKFEFGREHFYTDRILFNLLLICIEKLLINRQVMLKQIKNGFQMDSYGAINIKDEQVYFIKKNIISYWNGHVQNYENQQQMWSNINLVIKYQGRLKWIQIIMIL